jgi:hypothetical protein
VLDGELCGEQPEQEPMCPECKAGVLYECVACSSNNYPPQGAQEPDAWRIKVETKLRDGSVHVGYQLRNEKLSVYDEALYTAPPKRPWVDLTHDEWFKCWLTLHAADETEAEFDFADFLIIAQAVVAKLKEKNT